MKRLIWKGDPIDFVSGRGHLALDTWADFPAFIGENTNLKGYIFRGHPRSSFKLESTFLREFQSRSPGVPDASDLTIQERRFRLAIRGRIELTDREYASGFEVWAIGQHHGLATPLLDWTASPFVAAFFAYSESRTVLLREELGDEDVAREVQKFKKAHNEPRTVFALNARRINEIFFAKLQEELGPSLCATVAGLLSPVDSEDPEEGFSLAERIAEQLYPGDTSIYAACREAVLRAELEVPRVISPLSGENRRIISQRGLFTKFSEPRPLEDWVISYFNRPLEGRLSDEAILLKIDLPNNGRPEALRWLDAANINYLSLFPDLYGAAQFSNSKISGGP